VLGHDHAAKSLLKIDSDFSALVSSRLVSSRLDVPVPVPDLGAH